MLTGQGLLRRCRVLFDDARYVAGCNAGIPDVVRVYEDDWPLVVAAGAGVAQHRGRCEPAMLDLRAERLEELCATFAAAALFSWRGAHEDLA